MKKISLILLLVMCFWGISFASDADRQVTKQITSGDVTAIKITAGEVFSVTMTATSNGGWIALYDSASSAIAGKEAKIEIMEATANNTGTKEFPEGLNFYNGIYIERSNASAIVYYY